MASNKVPPSLSRPQTSTASPLIAPQNRASELDVPVEHTLEEKALLRAEILQIIKDNPHLYDWDEVVSQTVQWKGDDGSEQEPLPCGTTSTSRCRTLRRRGFRVEKRS
jgi:hypothetical protein